MAYRDKVSGAPFIQAFCRNMDDFVRSESLQEIFRKTRMTIQHIEKSGFRMVPILNDTIGPHLYFVKHDEI